MILVTGATGNIGRPTVQQLLEKGADVRVFVRDPARLGDVADKVDVAVGEISDEPALRSAMRGVERLYLHAIGGGNEEVTACVAAAKAEGVSRVVHLSSLSASIPGSPDSQWFHGRETIVKDAGFAWTMVRPGFFMSNVKRWLPEISEHGKVRWIGGRFSPVDTRDVAAVIVAALTEDGHEGIVHDLTGSELMDSREQVAILSDVVGRPIGFEQISVEDVMDEIRKTGAPEERIAFAAAVARALVGGQWELVTDTVKRVTGREPGTFRQWCIDHLSELN